MRDIDGFLVLQKSHCDVFFCQREKLLLFFIFEESGWVFNTDLKLKEIDD